MKKVNKTKFFATVIASLAVFAMTYFAMAQSQSTNNIFLDSDQDGLTNQEEKALGTDPYNPDTVFPVLRGYAAALGDKTGNILRLDYSRPLIKIREGTIYLGSGHDMSYFLNNWGLIK